MRRVGLASLLLACALAGALGAVLLAGPLEAAVGTTGTTTPPPTGPTTSGTTTTTPPPTTTAPPPPTTTAPPPAVLAPGVKVGGISVGGLTPEAAFAAVRTAVDAPLTIRHAGATFRPTPAQFGVIAYVQNAILKARGAKPNSQVPLLIRVNGPRTQAYVAKLAGRFDRNPVDSQLFLRNLRPQITAARPGRQLDRVAARQAITQALVRNERAPVVLTSKTLPPRVTPRSFGALVVIRRASNRLHLYHGTTSVRTFTVATGERRYPTPLGRFSVVAKWANPWWYPPNSDWARGKKPIPPGPGNPLGTRWMGISSPGVGIHGTPDGASLGYSVSHGCIRMAIPDAEWLFTRISVGTPVFIVAA